MTGLDVNLTSLAAAQAWQLTALILAVLLATRRWTQRRPHLAYVLWLLVLLKCLTPPLWRAPSSLFCWVETAFAAVSESTTLLPTGSDSRAVTMVAERGPVRQSTTVAYTPVTAAASPRHSASNESVGPSAEKAVDSSSVGLRSLPLTLWLIWSTGRCK